MIELYPEEKPGVRSAVGFGLGLGVASEVYREQESLGHEHEKLCQAERGSAEQSGGSGCGLRAPAPRGDPAPRDSSRPGIKVTRVWVFQAVLQSAHSGARGPLAAGWSR